MDAAAPNPHTAAALPGEPLDQGELKKFVGYLLARARARAFRAFDRSVCFPFQLRPVEFSVLVLLASNQRATQKQLSQTLDVAAPNMTATLSRLEQRGLLQRVRGEADRRVQYVTLTDQGRDVFDRAHGQSRSMDQQWLARLSPGEQAMLMELLEKLTVRG